MSRLGGRTRHGRRSAAAALCVAAAIFAMWPRRAKGGKLWRRARDQEAFWASKRRACPKVFVYELPAALTDWRPSQGSGALVEAPPGFFVPLDQVAENANLLEVILGRLAASDRCSTRDATKADLFLVPVLPKAKHWSAWMSACDSLAHQSWRLEHLDARTASRHFFVFPRVGYAPRCRGWWAQPMTDVLRRAARVAVGGYEELSGDFQRAKTLAKLSDDERRHPDRLVPRLISAPYVAAIRWASTMGRGPWTEVRQRRALFTYAGSPHGSQSAVALREALAALCRAHKCPSADASLAASSRISATLAKRNATFCLEPPGLTPGRASILTALLLGCIPVLFAPEQDELWPLHWGNWRRDSRLLVDAAPVVKDPESLVRKLSAVPPDVVKRMQRTIANHAHAMQYATDDMPGDALDVLLRGLDAAAHSWESRGDFPPRKSRRTEKTRRR